MAPSVHVTTRTAPHFNPRTNRAVPRADTGFCPTPLGLPAPNRRRPRVRLHGPRGPWSRTLGFGVPPRCGEDTPTFGFGSRHGVVMTCTRSVFDGRTGVAKTSDARAVTRRSQKRVIRRRGAQPDGVHRNSARAPGAVIIATRRAPRWFSPQRGGTPKPRVRTHAPRRGAEPWGRVRRRKCTLKGCDKTDVAPSVHVTTRTSPHFNPRTNRAVPRADTAFCSTPLGLPAPNRRRPRVRLHGPRGPWSRTLGFGVPPRCGEDTPTFGFGSRHVVVTQPLRRVQRYGETNGTDKQRRHRTRTRRVFTTTWWHNKAQGSDPRPKAWGRTLGTRAAPKMHPEGVRQDRRGTIRPRHHTHVPPFQPKDESGRAACGYRILFNPVGVPAPESSTPQGTAPRPSGAVEPHPGLWGTTTLW